jgi:hypothetical protein
MIECAKNKHIPIFPNSSLPKCGLEPNSLKMYGTFAGQQVATFYVICICP